jgi:hypothetical protein
MSENDDIQWVVPRPRHAGFMKPIKIGHLGIKWSTSGKFGLTFDLIITSYLCLSRKFSILP